jgi:GH43 family beta-xylosidase
MEGWDRGGIDGTILKHGNGQQYFSYVTDGALWIARLNNATSVHESRLRLRKDTSDWECCQNEGAFFFYHNNTSYLVFSGGDTWDPNYALGLMSIDGDKDPMNPSNWWFGEDKPVFWRNDEEDVYGPGHCSFTTSPDGTELWMVYHAASTPSYTERIARIDKITFDENGKPVFPRPSGANHVLNVPSGEV